MTEAAGFGCHHYAVEIQSRRFRAGIESQSVGILAYLVDVRAPGCACAFQPIVGINSPSQIPQDSLPFPQSRFARVLLGDAAAAARNESCRMRPTSLTVCTADCILEL
jgi:hypothetical protein